VSPADDRALVAIGLRRGDRVRYRRRGGGHWHEATVEQREADGSVGVRDGNGALRAIALERLEVRTVGPRGARTWESVAARAERDEQLGLW
jgi:hypothetical protein